MSSTNDVHPELQILLKRTRQIYEDISSYTPPETEFKPPIIDNSSDPSDQENNSKIPGLKRLRDAVKVDLDMLDKFLGDPRSARLPPLSTNSPYLIAVWNEVLCASPGPVVNIFKSMPINQSASAVRPLKSRHDGQPSSGVKVDVIYDSGRQWLRINTVKNSRLLAEFREIDSYLTDSSSDSEVDGDIGPTLAQKEFDNSVLRMGRSLLQAAQANPVKDANLKPVLPKVTLRLTRLKPDEAAEEADPRLRQTVQQLTEMGIEVLLGERPEMRPTARPSSYQEMRLRPTRCINLDLSILIALVSDITHSPLPHSIEEAKSRYVPSKEYREARVKRLVNSKKYAENPDRMAGLLDTDGELPPASDLIQHSRALTGQLLKEMDRGLLQELKSVLGTLPNEDSVEFWTTAEAKRRCLRIIEKIGGPGEKRRTAALLLPDKDYSIEKRKEDYWKGSRFATNFIDLFPIRAFPLEDAEKFAADNGIVDIPPFFRSLSQTCSNILRNEVDDDNPRVDPELPRRATPAGIPRLTTHTIESIGFGSALGWTTLTANRTSVRGVIKEMHAAFGQQMAQYFVPDQESRAAFWCFEPRSLAADMRYDTVP